MSRRFGTIAVVGAPNAGKSTLVNALVGQKVAIVTPKAQTTRTRLMGIAIAGEAQILLTDTPGIFEPKRRLDRAMVAAAWSSAQDADLIALVVDASSGLKRGVGQMLDRLKDRPEPKLLILNKVDLVKKEALLALIPQFGAGAAFEDIYMISATTGDGVPELKAALAARMPEGPWHFPEDQLTDLTLAITAAEVTREKLFLRIHDEIPYNATVETEKFTIQPDGAYRIDQVIYVTRDTHKKIILGAGGQTIKSIGADSRKELMAMYEVPVHLFLFVKVREKWGDDPERYREMGLEWTK
jgi:GTP-binding protein Era